MTSAEAHAALDRAHAALEQGEEATRAAHVAVVAVRKAMRDGRTRGAMLDDAIGKADAALRRERDLIEAERQVRKFLAEAEAEDRRLVELERRSRTLLGQKRVALAEGAAALVERLRAVVADFDATTDHLVAGVTAGDIDLGVACPLERLKGGGRINRRGERIEVIVRGLPDPAYERQLFGVVG